MIAIALKVFGWLTAGLASAVSFVLQHWKSFSVAAIAALLVWGGFRWGSHVENQAWTARWGARDAMDAAVDAEHRRQIAEVDGAIDYVEMQAAAERAARSMTFTRINEEVARYVSIHSLPALPGACPTDTDIGDDGLRLIERARTARVP